MQFPTSVKSTDARKQVAVQCLGRRHRRKKRKLLIDSGHIRPELPFWHISIQESAGENQILGPPGEAVRGPGWQRGGAIQTASTYPSPGYAPVAFLEARGASCRGPDDPEPVPDNDALKGKSRGRRF